MKKRFLVLLLTIVAVFALTSCSKKFTVNFVVDGETISSTEVKKNSTVSAPATPSKEGYEFVEWQIDGEKYNFSSKVTGDVTITAAFNAKTYKVNFLNGSTKNTVEVKHGEKVSKPSDPTKEGYVFEGWKLNGTLFDFTTPITGAVTLIASFRESEGVTFYTITLNLDGGTGETTLRVLENGVPELPTPTKEGYTFKGWVNADGSAYTAGPVIADFELKATWEENGSIIIQPGVYAPKWTPNQQTGGWNGEGMDVVILVLPSSSFDPFNADYTGTSKSIMQKQQRLVEGAYGINIVYEDWDDSAAWGPTRVNYIKQKYASGELQDDNKYIVNIASSWIPTLVKEGCLAELATIDDGGRVTGGIFTEIGYNETEEGSGRYVAGTYNQNSTNNQLSSSNGVVYGYVQGGVRPDYFMYYNASLIAQVGKEDPAELWLKGEWTWSKFEQYVADLQVSLNSLGAGYYALSLGFAEFVIGSCAASGTKIATTAPRLALTTKGVIDKFTQIQTLYASGAYNPSRGTEDVSAAFTTGNAAIVHGDLWFLGDATRFPSDLPFEIGAVPYPTADNQGGTPITTYDPSEAILGYDDQPLELEEGSGEYISGVDMSSSSFLIPYTSTGCYSIIDTENGTNGINNKILFAIIYDLFDGLGDDPEAAKIDADTAYRNWLLTKFDHELYADVIMSVNDYTYFEMIDLVSMTVGGGSHFGPNAFWPLAASICKTASTSPSTALNEVIDKYKEAMSRMGYDV